MSGDPDYKPNTLSTALLSSGTLTGSVAAVSAIITLLTSIDDRSDVLRILYTIVAALLFFYLHWMFVTAFTVLYDADVWNDDAFTVLTALDLFFMFVIVWTDTGVLFWLWDSDRENEGGPFTELDGLNIFSAWLVFLYTVVLILTSIGYGRYVPTSLLAEGWTLLLALEEYLLEIMILSSIIDHIRSNTERRKEKESKARKKQSRSKKRQQQDSASYRAKLP